MDNTSNWKSISIAVILLFFVAAVAYWVGSRSQDKFINEYREYRIEAQVRNDSLQAQLRSIQKNVIEMDSLQSKRLRELDSKINSQYSALKGRIGEIKAGTTLLDSIRLGLLDSLPLICKPALDLADGYKLQLNNALIELDSAQVIIDSQNVRNEVANVTIANYRAGFSQVGIVADSLGNIIKGLPKPPSGKFLGLIKMPKWAGYVAGVVTGAVIVSKIN